jgi:VWFA-related protein
VRVRGLLLRIVFFLAACWACAEPGFAQEQGASRQGPDVVRVNTALVQTDVMVFDKQGTFVDGLKRDQFILKIDGKPREISFFERIVAGSRNEEAQLAAARGTSVAGVTPGKPVPLDRGRTVFFFIDDLHLSLASNKQTRMLLQRFIDHDMGQNDEVAITSSSGQIGFLQQLTDDKVVLKAAVERLVPRSFAFKDSQRPVMTEYQAQLIEEQNEDVLTFFVDELIRLNPQLPRDMAATEIRGRASQIVQQTDYLSNGTLNSLKTLVRNAIVLPGRKLVFLVSDGFLLNSKNSDSNDRLRQITSAAAAAGVIIYSVDSRGLTSGMPDAGTETPFDPSGRLMRGAAGGLTATQDGLNILAADTGGRAYLNSNDLSAGLTRALRETSAYYLLAWRPEEAEQHNQRSHRIEVIVNGHPDLVIRFHHGFGDSSPSGPASQQRKEGEAGVRPSGELMVETLRAIYPKSDLPVSISLNFLDLAQLGSTLTASIRITTNSLVLEPQDDQQVAAIDVAGGVYDDQGKPVSSFNKHLTIKTKSSNAKAPPPDHVFYSHFCPIKPGLYQVRVATVDAKQGHAGSAVAWIEIPDLSSKALTLSSLIVGERKAESEVDPSSADASEPDKSPEPLRKVYLNIDHRFAGSSHLRFLTLVYNASGSKAAATPGPAVQGVTERANSVPAVSSSASANGADLAVQVQLFRDNEPVITMPLHKIPIDGLSDLQRLPYAAEINLEGLRPGRYLLLVTVIDRVAKASASQRFGFQVD